MRAIFNNALLTDGWRVGGIHLRPLAIGHCVLLRALGNTVACGGAVTIGDIGAAMWVCSQSFAVAHSIIADGKWVDCVVEFAKQVSVPPEKLREEWAAYFQAATDVPLHWRGKDDAKLRAPWEWHLVLTLCEHYNMTPGEAWETPVALARCYFDVWAETQGDKSLVTDEEKAAAPWIGEEQNGNC